MSSSTEIDDFDLELKKRIINVNKMFNMKSAKKKLTLEEKHEKANIEIKRAVFETDQFVKVNEIQRIVKDCIIDGDLYDKICRYELAQTHNRTKIEKMESVVQRFTQ